MLHSPAYNELKQNTAYRIVGGRNDDFWPGVLFWIDPRDGSLCISGKNGGWLEESEIPEDIFAGVDVEVASDYHVVTSFTCGGESRLLPGKGAVG